MGKRRQIYKEALEYGNSEVTKKSKVIELVARAQGKRTKRTRNSEGNIVLNVEYNLSERGKM